MTAAFRYTPISNTDDGIAADKISVISTDKVFRRIKDLIDLYYMSRVFAFDREITLDILKKNERQLGDFDGFLQRKSDLQHAYEKFRFTGDVEKPSFDTVYESVKEFIHDILPHKESPEERLSETSPERRRT